MEFKGDFWRQASFLRAATCCQRLQNSKLPLREDPALDLVLELGIASAEEGNILKHQNYSDCHHHDLKGGPNILSRLDVENVHGCAGATLKDQAAKFEHNYRLVQDTARTNNSGSVNGD